MKNNYFIKILIIKITITIFLIKINNISFL